MQDVSTFAVAFGGAVYPTSCGGSRLSGSTHARVLTCDVLPIEILMSDRELMQKVSTFTVQTSSALDGLPVAIFATSDTCNGR